MLFEQPEAVPAPQAVSVMPAQTPEAVLFEPALVLVMLPTVALATVALLAHRTVWCYTGQSGEL